MKLHVFEPYSTSLRLGKNIVMTVNNFECLGFRVTNNRELNLKLSTAEKASQLQPWSVCPQDKAPVIEFRRTLHPTIC